MNYDFYKKDKDIKADIKAAKTRGESIGLMEPLLIGDGSRHRPELTDLALDLAAKSAGLRRSLPETLLASLADLVRAMNCHYSNLIEGHDTPRSISNARSRAITVTTPGSAISSAAAVPPRRNDLDGRGNLSAENLAEFTRFFLAVCLDQVTDPRNLGAVCRSAEGAGATGVVLPAHGAARVTACLRSRVAWVRVWRRWVPR